MGRQKKSQMEEQDKSLEKELNKWNEGKQTTRYRNQNNGYNDLKELCQNFTSTKKNIKKLYIKKRNEECKNWN